MGISVIDPGTFDDEWFGSLSDREMLVWIGVFSRLRDDQGRFIENAALARARLWPYRDVPVADVQRALDRFIADGKLHRYTDGDQTILQIVNWWQHQHPQWSAASKLPSPEGWTDRIRTRLNGAYHAVNWDSPGGFVRDLRVNSSGEGVQVNPSPETLTRDPHLSRAIARPIGRVEPEPVPEPVKSKSTVSNDTAESAPEESTCDLITLPSSIRDDQELWPLLEAVLGRSAGALFNGKAKARSHAGTIRRLLADVCGFCSDLTSGITCERRAGWCRACALETLTRVAAADESIPFAQSLFTSAHELGDYCDEALAEQYRIVNSENPVAAGIAALAETMKPPVGMWGYPVVEGPDG